VLEIILAKRVFEIAKELNMASKAIVAKCRDEGIPESLIKNHMSSVSLGLEATIRQWFSEGHDSGSAVETTAKVDIAKARAKPRAKATKVGAPPETPDTPVEASAAVAVAAPPPAPPAPATPPPVVVPSVDEPADPPAPIETPVAEPEAPVAEPEAPVVAAEAPKADVGETPAPVAQAPATPKPGIRRAVPNVPIRPKVVKPAGPQLDKKIPVKLAGPKVVRVEAPERMDPPRPRRAPSYGGQGGGMGGGRGAGSGAGAGAGAPMAPPAGGGPDRSRGRGNKRRVGPGQEQTKRPARSERGGSGSGTWSPADLAEREARLARSGGFMKQRRQQAKHRTQTLGDRQLSPAERGGQVTITEPFTIKDLSAATGVKGAEIVKKLFMQGVMAGMNSGIDAVKAQEIMLDYEIELDVIEAKTAEQVVEASFAEREMVDQRARGPVVTILGHVDHGKTSLLDKIRNANVADGEAGGITQATSAFRVPLKIGDNSREVVFIDTPGHEAFTEMRARGANVTDLVVLVVAADDGVMPQTIESISHSKAAGVPIVVALNKIDRPDATDSNIQRILGQLAEHELNPSEWGGDTEVIRTSATEGTGIQELLEILEYQSELLELKADFGGAARGSVIESRFIDGRGPVASILVQDGKLKVGDFIVAGRGFGRVRDITDDRGKRIKEAFPPMPLQISGIDEIPNAGDHFFVVDSLKKAQEAAEQRRDRDREASLAKPKVTLDSMLSQMAESDVKEILVVLKADVQGSVDVVKNEIEKLSTDEVKIRVLHSAIGGVTESDVLLADASKAVIIGFNVIPSAKARQLADQKSVEIRQYQVIYNITDDVRNAAEGLLEPEIRQEILGHAEVRQVFKVSKVGTIAGCYITDGLVQRDAFIRVTRDDVIIENERVLEQLKRFKDDAKDVRSGMECGMKIVGYDDIKQGDILECYKEVEIKRTL